ncbi:hypothetical protein [Dokdonella sp.]|uniref:hypothetical protein n=1 Tax=Dokdonella sp. TaxID=2291710 RepID=UPI003C45438A
MFIVIPGDGMKPADTLADALRALPMATPPDDLFAQVSLNLRRRQMRRRWAVPTALAASVMLAAMLIWPSTPVAPPSNVQSATSSAAPSIAVQASEIDRLRADSRDLEAWLASLSGMAPRDGRSLMASAEIEDLVGLIDVQLSASRNDVESLPLWRQRVALLEDLASIRSEPLASMAQDSFSASPAPNLF